MEIREYKSVRKWFRGKKYKKRTKKVYAKYMATFSQVLEKNPDELISDVKTSDTPITEIETVHRRLAEYMNTKNMKVRSIDQRMNALHSFYNTNRIRLTSEIIRQLRHVVWDILGYEKKPSGKVATENTQ